MGIQTVPGVPAASYCELHPVGFTKKVVHKVCTRPYTSAASSHQPIATVASLPGNDNGESERLHHNKTGLIPSKSAGRAVVADIRHKLPWGSLEAGASGDPDRHPGWAGGAGAAAGLRALPGPALPLELSGHLCCPLWGRLPAAAAL